MKKCLDKTHVTQFIAYPVFTLAWLIIVYHIREEAIDIEQKPETNCNQFNLSVVHSNSKSVKQDLIKKIFAVFGK
jgi:hypothetical protein